MKHLVRLLVIVFSLVITSSFCFITESYAVDNTLQPYYVGTQFTTETFTINSSGKAFMNVSLTPKSSAVIDNVKITLKLNNIYGTSILNKTFNAEWDALSSSFELTKLHQLSSKGTYRFQAIYKCYKDGNLVETIYSSYKTYIY